MNQKQLKNIQALLVQYYSLLSKGYDTSDERRRIDIALKDIAAEQQRNRNNNLIATFKSWAKNTCAYLFQSQRK